MARAEDFDSTVGLPPGLGPEAIGRAIGMVEAGVGDLVEIYYEQPRGFSSLVGIFGTKALDSVSNYVKHRNLDTAQQRFPDPKRRGCEAEGVRGVLPKRRGSARRQAYPTQRGHTLI